MKNNLTDYILNSIINLCKNQIRYSEKTKYTISGHGAFVSSKYVQKKIREDKQYYLIKENK